MLALGSLIERHPRPRELEGIEGLDAGCVSSERGGRRGPGSPVPSVVLRGRQRQRRPDAAAARCAPPPPPPPSARGLRRDGGDPPGCELRGRCYWRRCGYRGAPLDELETPNLSVSLI
jgi:hypothetical protein